MVPDKIWLLAVDTPFANQNPGRFIERRQPC
jgi:hypothetical protein